MVVRRFLDKHEATSRNALLRYFKTSLSESLQRLTNCNVLTNLNQIADDETYLPRAIAFNYCGDAAAYSLARESTEIVLQAARKLFDLQLETERKEPFTPEDALSEARQIDPSVQPDMIWLGLYLAQEFAIFRTYQRDAKQIGVTFFQLSERIYQVRETENVWEQHIQEGVKAVEHDRSAVWQKAAQPALGLTYDLTNTESVPTTGLQETESRKVFLVHGRDKEALRVVSEFLRSLDLEVVILYKQPNRGRTVIEKFEMNSDVGFAVVLLTPDDVAAPISQTKKKTKRARQNVILELGYFIAKLGRERVCALQTGKVELPSDIHGIVYIPYDRNQKWRLKLAEEIDASGIKVDIAGVAAKLTAASRALDADGIDGHPAGDLKQPTHPQSHPSRRDRSAKGAKTARKSQSQKPWDLWLGFDGAGQNAMLSMLNRGPEAIFNATVKIPEDGSCFKSQPISRVDPGGSVYSCPAGFYDQIKNAVALALITKRIKSNAESIPVRISFTDLHNMKVDFDKLEVGLPFTASSFRRRRQGI